LSGDGKRLIASTMIAVRSVALETGEAGPSLPIPLGAVVDTTLSANGESLIIAQQPRILSVRLATGVADELLAYQEPHRAHLLGALSAGGKWAAMQAKQGTVVYDLTARKKATTLAAGPMYVAPVISSDGGRLASGTPEGVGLWETATGRVVARFEFDSGARLDWSADGRSLLGYSSRSPKLAVWPTP
jgi:hypothetical protein